MYFNKNRCYIEGYNINVKGIMWHSTGANNPNIWRYVQPDDGKSAIIRMEPIGISISRAGILYVSMLLSVRTKRGCLHLSDPAMEYARMARRRFVE